MSRRVSRGGPAPESLANEADYGQQQSYDGRGDSGSGGQGYGPGGRAHGNMRRYEDPQRLDGQRPARPESTWPVSQLPGQGPGGPALPDAR